MHHLNLSDFVRHNARFFPHKIAIRIDGASMSYAELARRVEEAAHVLGRHVQSGERVGLWFHNSFGWVVSFLALNSLGVISVPISTRLTSLECNAILRDAQAKAVIATRSYRGRNYVEEIGSTHQHGDGRLLVFGASDDAPAGDWPVTALGMDAAGPVGFPFEDTLCIKYTSGTTAKPKGVVLTNDAYLRTATYVARCQGLTPSSQFMSAGPFFHCSGTMHAITVCLIAGCTLNSLSIWDPELFLDQTEAQGCDVAHMIYFRDVLALGAERARPKLRSLKIAHDLGTADSLMRVHDELGVEGISNIYGMTETAGQFTMWFPDDPLESRVSANGRPQVGNAVRIADPETGAVVAPGESGEIQMCGPTVTPGYFNRPDGMAEGFTADGWLRSGDLGSVNECGELRYIARLKEIIRVGGENLAPAEVEQAIRDVTGAQQVCVIGIPDGRLDEVPAAVLVGAREFDWGVILGELRGKLAGFKIPKAVFDADEFPTTPTNRVQRAILKQWIAEERVTRIV